MQKYKEKPQSPSDVQKNHFILEVANYHKTMSKVLNFIWRQRRRIMSEEDLYSSGDINLLTNAFTSALDKGENARLYFIKGEATKAFFLTSDRQKSIPTTEYYVKFHRDGELTYQDSMRSVDYDNQ